MTTTVVATVVAAPVLALWAAYRGAPATGEGQQRLGHRRARPSGRSARPARYDHYENARQRAGPTRRRHFTGRRHVPRRRRSRSSARRRQEARPPADRPRPSRSPRRHAQRRDPLVRRADHHHRCTERATGPVTWSAWRHRILAPPEPAHRGALQPRRPVTLRVHVDHRREPAGAWTAGSGSTPAGAVVAIQGTAGAVPRAHRPGGYGHPHPTPRSPSPTGPAAHPERPRTDPAGPHADRRHRRRRTPLAADATAAGTRGARHRRASETADRPVSRTRRTSPEPGPPRPSYAGRHHDRIGRMRGHRQQRARQPLPRTARPAGRTPALPISSVSSGRYDTYTGSPGAVRRGRRRAPPVQVVAARAPAAPVVLADRDLQHPRVVRPVDPVVRPPDRQLPADVRLGLQRLAALAQRQDVQRAARAAREARPVLEDAGARPSAGSAARRPRPPRIQPASPCPRRGTARSPG